MTDVTIIPTTTNFSVLSQVLHDVQAACRELPDEERERHREAQRSVTEARRNAETHEGLEQVC